MTGRKKNTERITSMKSVKKIILKILRPLVINFILVGNINPTIKRSCDYIIFIDDTTGKDSIGERYILFSLMAGYDGLKSSKICVVVDKRLSFIPKMFSMTSKIIPIEEVTAREVAGSISSVYVSSSCGLAYRVIVNARIVFRAIFFRALHVLFGNSAGSDSTMASKNLENRKEIERLYYRALLPVRLKKFIFAKPDEVSNDPSYDVLFLFNSLGLRKGKVLFIYPQISGNWGLFGGYTLPSRLFEWLINLSKDLDFKYIINSKNKDICERYGNCLFLPLEKLVKFSELCGNLVSVRSGNVDFLSFTRTKKVVFYNKYLLNWYLIDRELIDNNMLQVYIDEDGAIDKTKREILDFLRG